MRTTIMLPDDLYDDIKVTAARERRTVTSVIEEALRESLEKRARSAARATYRVDVVHGARLREGLDLDDTHRLLDVMDGLE